MPDPIHDRAALAGSLRLVAREAEEYLDSLDDALVRPHGTPAIGDAMPESGNGAMHALSDLIAASIEGAVQSSGPRYFHFVTGGVTPAALGADWLASVLDQMAYNWTSSPFASRLEQVATSWLRDLFGIPSEWSAVITTGATMANFVGLAAARRWWGLQHAVDVDNTGLGGLPPVPVFAGGYLHASAVKALGMLGIGRQRPRILTLDAAGRIDLAAVERELKALEGKPAILLATAGDVNTGDSTRSARWRSWHADTARGCMWTALLACSPP